MRITNTLYTMLFNKCPQCHQGQVFKSKNPYAIGRIFEMHEKCEHCELKFEKETGFFTEHCMFHALTSGWFLTWFVLYLTVLKWDTFYFALFIAGTLIALSPLAIRWSRLIWLNFFYKYKKELNNSNHSNHIHNLSS
ncbi:MAG: DUF983 domain-containing protein [Bacteroidetes bacterium]|nr:DUF983 domain-containing protein [Bacteroidota bacterium]